jgi:hypothetical protein
VRLVAVLAVLLQAAAPTDAEWVALGTQGGRALVYRTAPLATRNAAVTHALVMVAAGGSGAEAQFRVAIDAARRAGVLERTLIVTPRIPSNDAYVCLDDLAEREVNWGCQANNGWAAGGTARGDDALTSYDVVDTIIGRLAARRAFPNLTTIVVAGHSAGGQFTVRYAMANRVHDTGGVRIRYVVANPAHYPYPDGGRPVAGAEIGCRIWNVWPYGLEDRVGYSARVSDEDLRRQLASRPVTYLLGEQDTRTTGGLDTTCAAMAQGPFRLARGQNFARYLNERYKAGHQVIVVPGCGHDGRCMFTAPDAWPALFALPSA